MKYKTVVLGAGVGGLGAGCWLKAHEENFIIIEKQTVTPMNLHNGVHYLHSKPKLPFNANLKEILLTDGVLTADGRIRHHPELQDALMYSEKVRSIQHPSSIYEVGKRKSVYVPKSNNMNDYIIQMVEFIGDESFLFNSAVARINLEEKYLIANGNKIHFENLISTLPLDIFLDLCNEKELKEKLKFDSTPINILNFKAEKIVPNWLINIYVPDPKEKVYRLSILNRVASIESVEKIDKTEYGMIQKLFNMFYLCFGDSQEYEWKTGKIVSLDIDTRREVFDYFIPKSIFPLGRFGCWNNKLLIDSTINQAKEICKYTTIGEPNKFDTEDLIKALL